MTAVVPMIEKMNPLAVAASGFAIGYGIRTREAPKGLPDFQSGAFDHSANPPSCTALICALSYLVSMVGFFKWPDRKTVPMPPFPFGGGFVERGYAFALYASGAIFCSDKRVCSICATKFSRIFFGPSIFSVGISKYSVEMPPAPAKSVKDRSSSSIVTRIFITKRASVGSSTPNSTNIFRVATLLILGMSTLVPGLFFAEILLRPRAVLKNSRSARIKFRTSLIFRCSATSLSRSANFALDLSVQTTPTNPTMPTMAVWKSFTRSYVNQSGMLEDFA